MARKTSNDDKGWRTLVPSSAAAPTSTHSGKRRFWRWFKLALLLAGGGAVVALGALAWQELSPSRTGVILRSAVRFDTNEQLTKEWFLEFSGLTANISRASIFDIDEKLRSVGQIKKVRINRHLTDDGIDVKVEERTPVLRMDARLPNGSIEVRAIAADGVIYKGINYGPLVFRNLPLLTDARPVKQENGRFQIVPGMDAVARLLQLARRNNPDLYQEWESVSVREFRNGDAGAPGACIRIRMRESRMPPVDRPRIREVIFSANAKDFEDEYLRFYANTQVRALVGTALRKMDIAHFPLYDWYLCLENKTDQKNPQKEPRLIPVRTGD
ncbi:MAG: hypothetical protein LBV54_02285 [Puniceicoccales bacterium]|jgi:hypothetical protein|nr:hypothetical protein [Puniceicoccales bacterium]